MKVWYRSLVPLLAAAFLAACSDAGPLEVETTDVLVPESASTKGSAGFPIYGLGPFSGAATGPGCAAPAYVEFDFWLGDWNVFDPEGEQVGTNSVTSALNGCVVAEHWVDAGGVPGRSINTFDSETGQWHQTWVSANFSGHLRMAGGLDDAGRMILSGSREGVRQGVTLFDEYTWTPLGPDRVEQVGSLRVPAAGFEGTFVGIYERVVDLVPAPESPTTGCQAGGPAEQARQLDFWIGEWTLSSANGLALGTSTVRADLSGCLVEERFRAQNGYEAISFAYFDVWERRWFRTYIDNRGERLELRGGLEAGPRVLSGAESGPGTSGSVLLRMTIEPAGIDTVSQQLEVSRDDGETWQRATELLYTQRP